MIDKLTVNKPWGNFEQITLNTQTTVKILTVNPNSRLSYQDHQKRDEFWKCIKNSVSVSIDGNSRILYEGDEVFIPKGSKHRLAGLDKEGKVLEVSFGHFDENDIVRYEDDYGR